MNIIRVLKVLRVVGELIPVIGNIFAIFGRTKAQKKAKILEKVNQVVIEGVDTYQKIVDKKEPALPVKEMIKRIAVTAGVEDKLHELVIKYTTPKLK